MFFWPGDDTGPRDYGRRHFEHYKKEQPVILRMDFESLRDVNPHIAPQFCRYNSGSPRCSYGKKSPRGPDTFVPAENFNESAKKVVEVTFESEIILPANARYARDPEGPWRALL